VGFRLCRDSFLYLCGKSFSVCLSLHFIKQWWYYTIYRTFVKGKMPFFFKIMQISTTKDTDGHRVYKYMHIYLWSILTSLFKLMIVKTLVIRCWRGRLRRLCIFRFKLSQSELRRALDLSSTALQAFVKA